VAGTRCTGTSIRPTAARGIVESADSTRGEVRTDPEIREFPDPAATGAGETEVR